MSKKLFVKRINADMIVEMADIPSVIEALGLPYEEYKGMVKVLNVWRVDTNLGSAYFRQDGRFVDWADHSEDGKDIIHYVRQVKSCGFVEACRFIAEASGFSLDNVQSDIDIDDLDAQAKQRSEIKALKEKNEKIGKLLGLDGQQLKKWEYSLPRPWNDNNIIAIIEDGCEYKVHSRSRGDMWKSAREVAKHEAKRQRGKVIKIDDFDLVMSDIDYASPDCPEKNRKYCDAVESGRYPQRDYLVITGKLWEPSLAEFAMEDPEGYQALIERKKRERLQELREERQYVEDSVFDDDEYDHDIKVIDELKKEIMAI